MSVQLRDFCPFNRWEINRDRESYAFEPKYLFDQTADRAYRNESKWLIRFKCLSLTLATPIVHTVASIVNVAYRVAKLVTLSHFWCRREGDESYNFLGRAKDAAQDIVRIAAAPIALLGLELSAMYGVFVPYDGRKMFATIERAFYGRAILAPSFQPMIAPLKED